MFMILYWIFLEFIIAIIEIAHLYWNFLMCNGKMIKLLMFGVVDYCFIYFALMVDFHLIRELCLNFLQKSMILK